MEEAARSHSMREEAARRGREEPRGIQERGKGSHHTEPRGKAYVFHRERSRMGITCNFYIFSFLQIYPSLHYYLLFLSLLKSVFFFSTFLFFLSIQLYASKFLFLFHRFLLDYLQEELLNLPLQLTNSLSSCIKSTKNYVTYPLWQILFPKSFTYYKILKCAEKFT